LRQSQESRGGKGYRQADRALDNGVLWPCRMFRPSVTTGGLRTFEIDGQLKFRGLLNR